MHAVARSRDMITQAEWTGLREKVGVSFPRGISSNNRSPATSRRELDTRSGERERGFQVPEPRVDALVGDCSVGHPRLVVGLDINIG